MRRVLAIAWREYASTVLTKAFIIGAVVVPAVLAAAIPVVVWIISQQRAPAIEGEVAVIDPTGEVAPALAEYLAPESIARRRGDLADRAASAAPGIGGAGREAMGEAMERVLGEVPRLEVRPLPPQADPEAAKERILRPAQGDGAPTVAVATVAPDAVVRAEGSEAFGGFALSIRPRLDDRIVDEIRRGLRQSILGARYRANGFDRASIEALVTVRGERTTEVTEQGEVDSNEAMRFIVPVVMMMLVLGAVFTGGQYLLTTTIEEKSNRVVEVLLSAVSPMRLMVGKILGQMCVGLTMLVMYSGLGVAALVSFSLAYLIDASTLGAMFLFFFAGYGMIAALMAAAGAAVNDLREAQSLMTPVMMVMLVPYLGMVIIPRNPNSTLAVVLSFIPPINPFIMMLRMASNDPPPAWQVAGSLAVAAVGVVVCMWLAAKIFRVGMLMFGKPPDFRTLVRWVRMA